MDKEYLLVEDECAPDARWYFEKQLKELTGLTISDFKEKGKVIKSGCVSHDYTKAYVLDGYKLEYFIEEPYYHLSKVGK